MVGHRFEWRDDKIWEVGRGFLPTTVILGEYIRTPLTENRCEFKSILTGERFILKEDETWMGGPYFLRGDHAFSFKDPELKIKLSEKAKKSRRWMFGERPVYRDDDKMVRDATNDRALFEAPGLWICDAGFVVRVGEKLHFTDGVRKDLPLGKIVYPECVRFLRVSETEYSIQVGRLESGYRYFLLDTAKWTYHRVYFFCFGRMVRVARRQSL